MTTIAEEKGEGDLGLFLVWWISVTWRSPRFFLFLREIVCQGYFRKGEISYTNHSEELSHSPLRHGFYFLVLAATGICYKGTVRPD